MPQQRRHSGSKYPCKSPHRRPRTTAERRAAQEGWHRLRRGPSRLPNARDDLIRGRLTCRSWKDYRRTQYRPRPA